jgi:predicted glycosyltransferase
VPTAQEGDEVDSKPRVFMYSHDSSGLGHLRRTLELAKAFVEHDPGLGVLILTGSTVSGAFRMPQGIDIVKLPSAVKVSNGVYKPGRLPVTFERLRKLRSDLIEACVIDSSRSDYQGEHRLRQAGRYHGGDYPGRQSSQRPRLHNGSRRWVRDRHR